MPFSLPGQATAPLSGVAHSCTTGQAAYDLMLDEALPDIVRVQTPDGLHNSNSCAVSRVRLRIQNHKCHFSNSTIESYVFPVRCSTKACEEVDVNLQLDIDEEDAEQAALWQSWLGP